MSNNQRLKSVFMAIRQQDGHSYGDSQEDIRTKLIDYSEKNAYPATHFGDAVCVCGGRLFRLFVDEVEGAALRICSACSSSHPIGDSAEYLKGASLEECECLCGNGVFEITVGVALYGDSEDVRWLYIGCRCPKCGLTGCYGDWKNEFIGYRELLERI